MGDPTGLSAIAIQKLVDIGIAEFKTIRDCKEKGKALGAYLETVRPVFDEAYKTSLKESGKDSTVSIWLDEVNKVFEKAELEVRKCANVHSWSVRQRRRLSTKVLQLTTEIDTTLYKHAPVVLIDLALEQKKTLNEQKKTLNVVASGVARIETELSQAHAHQILDNIRKLPDIVLGTKELLVKLENLLVGESQNEWVGIHGRGGIGKTVLAGETFNSENVRAQFLQQFWVTVAHSPSIEALQRNLAEQISTQMKVNCHVDNLKSDEAMMKLSKALERKKVLLVLDDVWDDGVDVLGMLGVTSKGTGSKILVTTREPQVLKKAKARDECLVGVDILTDENSLKLFCKYAFEGDEIPDDLDQTLIKKVVDECKGLPLALKVIARSFAGETHLASEIRTDKWESQLKKLQESLPLGIDQELQLYGILRPSFEFLHPRLQKCFLYFAAFPEDSDVDSQELARLWAGEKLLEGSHFKDPLKETFYLLTELMQRSLIDFRWNNKDNPWHIECRMHDVLRDFALYIGGPHKRSCETGTKQIKSPMGCRFRAGRQLTEVPKEWLDGDTSDVTHISLIGNPLELLSNELRAPKLEVLLLNRSEYIPFSRTLLISPEILQSFSSLKVLNLKDCPIESLPDTVGSLKNLIYLDLSRTRLVTLPLGLQELTKLETLSLQGCTEISPWPFDISRFQGLSTLYTDGCIRIWDLVPGGSFPERNIDDSLESVCEIPNLLNLSISSASRKLLPSCFMNSMSGISSLDLTDCSELTSLPDISQFPKLAILNLSNCRSLTQLPDGFTKKGAFPVLQELELSDCVQLSNFPLIEEGSFPCLKELTMRGCESLKELLEGFM